MSSSFQSVRIRSINQQALLVSASALTGAIVAITCNGCNTFFFNASSLQQEVNLFAWNEVYLRSLLSGSFIQHHPHLRYAINEFGNTNNYTSVILAASPILSTSGVDKQMHNNHRWWRLNWMILPPTSSDDNTKSTWLQRIGRMFFVVTRGVEIVLRLSPLLILTPTAILVETSNSLIKRIGYTNKNAILSTSCELRRVDEDDDLLVKPFQEFEVAGIRNVRHGTWAANLAWRYTLHTLQTLGPAFCKLGQWLV